MSAYFSCRGASPVLHTLTRRLLEWKINSGWSILSSSDGRESGPTAFEFGIPRVTAVVSTMVFFFYKRQCYHDRFGKESLIAETSQGDYVLRRAPRYPAHRSRIHNMSFGSEPCSSRMNCSLLALLRPSPTTVLFRCL